MTIPNVAYPIPLDTVPTIWRGDPFTWRLTLTDAIPDPIDLTAYGSAWAAMLRTSTDGTIAISFTVDITHLTSGYVILSLTGVQTAAMTADAYGFDVQATGGAESPFTVWKGSVRVDGDYTR